jgi:hypothetical protein
MAVDQRRKNANWKIVDDTGEPFSRYEHKRLAVLMDLRDELQLLNRVLRTMNRKLRPRKPRRKAVG